MGAGSTPAWSFEIPYGLPISNKTCGDPSLGVKTECGYGTNLWFPSVPENVDQKHQTQYLPGCEKQHSGVTWMWVGGKRELGCHVRTEPISSLYVAQCSKL